MLSQKTPKDIPLMKKFYRARDMFCLIENFPEICHVKDLTIIEDLDDYIANKNAISSLEVGRIDCPVGEPIFEWNVSNMDFFKDLKEAKAKNPSAVLLLFNLDEKEEKRYEHFAGISIRVDVGESIFIEAVGKGFDGSEVSKGICSHERYFIPWLSLVSLNAENFKTFQTYQTSEKDYEKTRAARVKKLISMGFEDSEKFVPKTYRPIPNEIWSDLVKNLLKPLLKREDELELLGLKNFAISGHTRGLVFCPWQVYNEKRYLR